MDDLPIYSAFACLKRAIHRQQKSLDDDQQLCLLLELEALAFSGTVGRPVSPAVRQWIDRRSSLRGIRHRYVADAELATARGR